MTSLPQYCPYLGTKFDRNTKWGYASHLATCYLSENEPFAPSLSHQQRFCLTERYPQCFRLTGQPTVVAPMYDMPGTEPAPAQARGGAYETAQGPQVAAPAGLSAVASDLTEPPRANPDAAGPNSQPHAQAGPAARTAPGRFPPPRRDPRSETAFAPGAMAVIEGLVATVAGAGRMGLAAIGALLLLVFAFIFLLQVFGNESTSQPETTTPVPGSKQPAKGVVGSLPAPKPGANPTASVPVKSPGVAPKPVDVQTQQRPAEVFNTDGFGLSLRDGPSATANRIAVIVEGDQIIVIGSRTTEEGEWLEVEYEGQTGWAFAEYIRDR